MNAKIWSNDRETQRRLGEYLTLRGITFAHDSIEQPANAFTADDISRVDEELVFLVFTKITSADLNIVRQFRQHMADGCFLVVCAPTTDHQVVLGAIRAGANDFVSTGGALEKELDKLLKRTESERLQPNQRGRTITVTSCHCPTDATFVAVNLAAALASSDRHCGLLDFHWRGGDVASLLELQPRHTIHDLVGRSAAIDSAIFLQALTPHKSGIRLLAGPTLGTQFQVPNLDELRQIHELAGTHLPQVVINTPDPFSAEELGALNLSDSVVLIMRMDVVSLHRATLQVRHMQGLGVGSDSLRVVALQSSLAGELSISVVKRALQIERIQLIPENCELRMCSVNVGNPVVLEAPRSRMARAITDLAQSLAQPHQGTSQDTSSGLLAANLKNRLSRFSKRLSARGEISSTGLIGVSS